MATIGEHMTTLPHTIGQDSSVELALEKMREFHCHHLPVLEGGHLVGVISDRDLYLATTITKTGETTIKDIMMDDPYIVEPSSETKSVLQEMLNKKISSAIVKATPNNDWGIFTTTDAIRLYINSN